MKKNLKWIICLVSITVFIILAFLVYTHHDIYLDTFVYKYISKYITSNLTSVVKYLTYIGSGIVVISITLFTFIFNKNKKYGLYMSIDLIIITIIQKIIKLLIARGRPVDINLINETGYSFPSGHSLTAMAFYGFIICLIYTSNINKNYKKIYITVFSILILIVGISRIYLGVHYFSDVIGGFTLSISYLIIYTNIIGKKIKA